MGKAVLIVDDSPSIRGMVAFTLKSAGYSVTEAPDGAAGLTTAKAGSYSLVITDQNMPQMDGISLIKALRGLAEYQATPLLMLTTEASDEMKEMGRSAGATGWIVKPFDPQKLLAVVKKVIG